MHIKHKSRKDIAASLKVPVKHDGVCNGCKFYFAAARDGEPEPFLETPFGDYLCRRCYEQDAFANPDLYGDPLITPQSILDGVIDMVRVSTHTIEKFNPYQIKNTECTCVICDRKPSDRNKDIAWVRTFRLGSHIDVCRACYEKSRSVTPHEYYLDAHGRAFEVTAALRARYPFGIRALPYLFVSEGASEKLFELQHERMTEQVNANIEFVLNIVSTLDRRYRQYSYDEIYDTAINVLMVAASLYQPDLYVDTSFQDYVANSIRKEVKRLNRKRRVSFIDSESNTTFEVIDPNNEIESIERREQLKADLIEWQAECEKIVGAENWFLFTSWLYHNRTQEELGNCIGVIKSTISARLIRVRILCAEIANKNPKWTHLANIREVIL